MTAWAAWQYHGHFADSDPPATTATIKLEALLEEPLRQRAQGTGRSTSDVVREALQAYPAQPEPGRPLVNLLRH